MGRGIEIKYKNKYKKCKININCSNFCFFGAVSVLAQLGAPHGRVNGSQQLARQGDASCYYNVLQIEETRTSDSEDKGGFFECDRRRKARNWSISPQIIE